MFATTKYSEVISDYGDSGVRMMMNSCSYDTLFQEVMIDSEAILQSIEKQKDKHIFEELLQKQIIENKNRAIVVTTPKAGLLESNEKKDLKALEKKLASMSSKDKKTLIKTTKDFSIWNQEQTSSDVLKSIQAVSLAEMDTDVKDYNIKETKIDKVTLLSADIDTPNVSNTNFYYDLSHLDKEELYYLQFYMDLIRIGMPTTKRTMDQVLNDKMQNACGFGAWVNARKENANGTKAHAVLDVNFYCLNKGFDDALDVASDVLLSTDLSKMKEYADQALAQQKAFYEEQFLEPYQLIEYRAKAYTNEWYRYMDFLHGLDYYHFLLDVENKIKAETNTIIKKIEDVRSKAFNKQNLIVLYVGNSRNSYINSLKTYIDKMQDGTYKKVDLDLPKPAKREAFEINSAVQYISTNASLLANQVPDSGMNRVVSKLLNSLLFIPKIRLEGGAYGASASFYMDNYSVSTNRDPNYATSLDVIHTSNKFLSDTISNIDNESLEGYKLSVYARDTAPTGEVMGGLTSLFDYMEGVKVADKVKMLNEIKKTTLDDIKAFIPRLAILNQNTNYVVAASATDIQAHKELFDRIVKVK